MDGRTVRTDGRRDRRTNGPTPTDQWTDAPTDRPTDRSTKRPADRPTDLVREWQVLHPPCPGHTACQRTTVTFILHCPAQIRVQRVRHRVPSGSQAALQPLRRRGATAIEAMWSTNASPISAAEGDPWWTDLDEATLQELFETSPRESMEFRAASEAGSTSSESADDAAYAMQRLSMTVPLWAPIVQMPESPEDRRHTRDAAGHCKICGPDLYHMCLPMSQPTKCPLRNRW